MLNERQETYNTELLNGGDDSIISIIRIKRIIKLLTLTDDTRSVTRSVIQSRHLF